MMNPNRWASAMLEMLNLRFVVIDTTGLDRDADMLRFLTLDRDGDVTCDIVLAPGRHPGAFNQEYTGITQEELELARHISAAWPMIQDAIKGNLFLAYGLRFIRERLEENTTHYNLPPVTLIGNDLMSQAINYFGLDTFSIKLSDACARIGHTLPSRPNAEARAVGQLALLKAMAAGPYVPPRPQKVEPADLDRPF